MTGSSRGIGRGIALALAEEGCDLMLTGRDAAALAEVAAGIQKPGRRAQCAPADLARPTTRYYVADTPWVIRRMPPQVGMIPFKDRKISMITSWHDKDGFFKYYTAASAKLTLKHTSRRWSTPLLFNDPFDNQFDLYFEEPSYELIESNINQFHEITTSREPLKANQFGSLTSKVELIRQARLQNPDRKYTDDQIAYLQGGVIEGMQRVIKITPEINAEIRRIMADTTVFCLSETHDNLLMWSHYAQNHTGAVVKFLSLPEVDSPIIVVQPVRYIAQMPRLKFAAMFDSDKARKDIRDTITLTKSEVWAYEKEWRIICALREKTRSCEILPYATEEVGAVYLGCKITDDDKQEIIEITRSKYAKAKIFQAEKHDRKFALVFREIT